jgi:hypothetical protein
MTASDLNPTDRNRRALYAELPFISIYGMQYREQSIAKSLSRVNLADMGAHGEEPSLSDIDLDEVSHTAVHCCCCCWQLCSSTQTLLHVCSRISVGSDHVSKLIMLLACKRSSTHSQKYSYNAANA